MELTRDPDRRVPFKPRVHKVSDRTTVLDEVAEHARQEGVYVLTSMNTIVVTPPLGVNETHIDEGIAALDVALEHADDAVNA